MHELKEITLMKNGMTYEVAHKATLEFMKCLHIEYILLK